MINGKNPTAFSAKLDSKQRLISVSIAVIILLVLILTAGISYGNSETTSLEVILQSQSGDNGRVVIILYQDAKTWLGDNPYSYAFGRIEQGMAKVEIAGLQPGTFAVFAFHDRIANYEFDEDWLGRPKESYGFSNGDGDGEELSFEQARIQLRPGRNLIKIKLVTYHTP
ncbi:MAG: DUF2141 domain-containing protein [Acidobacteriota bacterium]